MQTQPNPNSSEKSSRVQPELSNDVVSRSNAVVVVTQDTKPTSYFLAPAETRKATINLDKAIEYELKHGRKLDPTMDRKKLRRTVSNRLSAQRSRQKKAHYIDDMEKRVAELEETIIVLTVRVERMIEKRKLLQLQNEALERLLLVRTNEANHHQMMLEKNQVELNMLKEVEKDLLKILEDRGRFSGLYEDRQVQKESKEAMDRFLRF